MTETHSQDHSASAPPTINVTPLIDVLLVLLIIFMVIQPQREAKLPVRAPAAAPIDTPASPETLMLTVTSGFQLALNSKPLTLDELLPKLSELMEHRQLDARTLFIKAPRLVQYGSVVLLIDLAKGAGVTTVGLSADEPLMGLTGASLNPDTRFLDPQSSILNPRSSTLNPQSFLPNRGARRR
ncbi:MAG: biopolymer transporter ExbD [Acidobacteriota bacterium]